MIPIISIGLIFGILMSFFFVLIGMVKEFLYKKKKSGKLIFKIVDFMSIILIPLVFGIIGILVPINLLENFFSNKILTQNYASIYI